MGIPYYFSYIIKNYPSILVNRKCFTDPIHNFYLDSNSIIYDIFYEMEDLPTNLAFEFENILIDKVISKINFLIELINPINRVFIAFDGVAPIAKLEQQRSRRYKSNYQSKIKNNILSNYNKNPINKNWSTCNITPGTNFMNKINDKINNYYKSNNKVIFSGPNAPGEGEHKIFSFIRNNKFHSKESTLIYGLDADLIMLCLNHMNYCQGIHLWRETPTFIKSLQTELDPKETYILNVKTLSEKIMIYLEKNIKSVQVDLEKCMKDYIFLCFLLGNDFLPHFPSINIRTGGIDKLLLNYSEIIANSKEYLIENNKINWKLLSHFINVISDQEEKFLIEEYQLRNKKEKQKIKINDYESQLRLFELTPMFQRETEHFINPKEAFWQKRYYSSLLKIKNDDNYLKRKKLCNNYLAGLEWTFQYYNGECIDWEWKYNYNYPPLLIDLKLFIPTANTTSFFNNKKVTSAINPLVQLAYVLPIDQLQLLPFSQRKELYKNFNQCYSNNWEFEFSFCKYFWESHVIMEDIDINELKKIIK